MHDKMNLAYLYIAKNFAQRKDTQVSYHQKYIFDSALDVCVHRSV